MKKVVKDIKNKQKRNKKDWSEIKITFLLSNTKCRAEKFYCILFRGLCFLSPKPSVLRYFKHNF